MLIIALPPYRISYARAPESPHKPSIAQLIAFNASKYHVSEKTMHKVIKCESNYISTAVGDHGHSFGLSQIHLPSNPTVTKEQALDPEFAIDFLAKNLSQGKGNKWTCYRNIV